ncbi:hypothetical protein D0865_07602 [Hortaea werneckii]|uniref:Shugoshin C-terminal domain-containing protein n=1 Tax=Hortaea werneckii TaxID=91943 RepID=A0A3M7CB48_HORWE|nr:hypothetical protein D0865_07602 [Hortaea werneckii]
MARLNEPPTAPANHTTSTLAAAGGENVDACATMRTKSRPVPVAPPTDFLEVKRRFIRQNRELAKNNSSQSLRIRSLELEVSRLLSDNLELREKVFRLEGELFTARGKVSSDAVRKVKDALLAKIGELSGVVEGLDEAAEEQEPRSEKSVGKPMMEGQWRERQPLAELMRDSQMPTIVEDKLYPRRTLNAEEIQAIRLSGTGSNESPDLGPPPVAHFDYGDPEKAPASPTQTSPSKAGEDDGLPGLSVNLETRRRRKDGQPRLEIRRHSILPQSPEKSDTEPSTMLRTGAKRKLSDREIDQPIKPPTQADFTFSRKGEKKAIVAETEKEVENEPAQQSLAEITQDIATTPSKPVRKVLGDKSVNQSPRKNNVPATGKPNKPEKEESKKPEKPAPKSNSVSARGQSRNRRGSNIPQPSPSHDDSNNILPTVEIPPPSADVPTEPPPKTPAAATDIFSPTPSEPSARQSSQPEPRAGTPPPSDLSALSTTSAEGAGPAGAGASGRPSRRARSAVNYAEPSLVAKMRRPGRGMVDAVTGLQDTRRTSSNASGVTVTGERKVPAEEQQRKGRKIEEKEEVGDGEVFIKPEPTEDDEEAWKGLPCSSGAGEDEIVVRKEEEDEQGVGSPSGNPEDDPHTHSSSANLTAPNHKDNTRSPPIDHPDSNDDKSRRRKRLSLQQPPQSHASTNDDTDENLRTTTSKLAELDLYDFKDPASSSSPPPSTSTSSHLPKAPSNPPRKGRTPSSSSSSSSSSNLTTQQQKKTTHRRHSSVPRDSDTTSSVSCIPSSAGSGAGSGVGVGGVKASATGSAGRGSAAASASERGGRDGSSGGGGGDGAGRRRSMML